MRRLAAFAALTIAVAAGDALAATSVKVEKAWTGQMPLAVQPLLQSSVASAGDWSRVWATCQGEGAAPAVDFDRHLVLLAVRRSSSVRIGDVRLDKGALTSNVSVAPDSPGRMTCAMALVDRKGVRTVNGQPLGK